MDQYTIQNETKKNLKTASEGCMAILNSLSYGESLEWKGNKETQIPNLY